MPFNEISFYDFIRFRKSVERKTFFLAFLPEMVRHNRMQTIWRSHAVLYNDVLRRSEKSGLHILPVTKLLTHWKKNQRRASVLYDSLESANKQTKNGKNNNLCWNVNRTRVRDVKRPWRRIIRRPTTMLKSIKMLLLVTHWIKMRAHTQKRKPNYNCSHISVLAGWILVL